MLFLAQMTAYNLLLYSGKELNGGRQCKGCRMRFLRLLGFLFFVMIGLISTTRIYGQTKSVSSELRTLKIDGDNNQLHFLGIKPGTTTWQEVLEIMHKAGARR